jgi:hypothetical protein
LNLAYYTINSNVTDPVLGGRNCSFKHNNTLKRKNITGPESKYRHPEKEKTMRKANVNGVVFIVGIIIFVFVVSLVVSTFFQPKRAEGIPPSPHATEGYLESECSSCHLRGIRQAPIFDHPERENCLTCH